MISQQKSQMSLQSHSSSKSSKATKNRLGLPGDQNMKTAVKNHILKNLAKAHKHQDEQISRRSIIPEDHPQQPLKTKNTTVDINRQ
jgi:hypothetical protein